MIDATHFSSHATGRRFADVLSDSRLDFRVVLDFFNRPDVQRRMRHSEMHHDRAPLAGVVREFERLPAVDAFFRGFDAHTTGRARQAVGVLQRIHMEAMGWEKSGSQATLGRRAPVQAGTTAPGAYYNRTGLARWFTQTERYRPAPGAADRAEWESLTAR